MTKVCHNVGIQPQLQDLPSDLLHHATSIRNDGVRLDTASTSYKYNIPCTHRVSRSCLSCPKTVLKNFLLLLKYFFTQSWFFFTWSSTSFTCMCHIVALNKIAYSINYECKCIHYKQHTLVTKSLAFIAVYSTIMGTMCHCFRIICHCVTCISFHLAWLTLCIGLYGCII